MKGLKRSGVWTAVWIMLGMGNAVLLAAGAIQPIPQTIPYDREKARLGRQLFFDPHLSRDGTVACVTCHHPDSGADTTPVSIGIAGQKGGANTPTVFNSVFNFRQMWNGHARDLKEQVRMPVHNPVEMAMDRDAIARYLGKNPRYREAFRRLYGHDPDFDTMSDAIAEFEKSLITPNCKFDRYLRHEVSLSPEELRGYKLFKRLGCVTCHNGINIGGNSYQKMGLIHPYRWHRGTPDRYALTRKEADKNIYKVPSLRNVALTAPYFHDGSAPTLREALKRMAYHNLGFELSPSEIDALLAFLKTLTGEPPATMKGIP